MPGCHARAGHQRAVGRDDEDLRVGCAADRVGDAGAVGRPAGVVLHGEGGDERPGIGPVRVDHVNVQVVHVGAVNVREPIAGRRPCRIGVQLGSLRQPPEAAAVLAHRVELEVARAIAGERDRAGRRPRGLAVVRGIRGEPRRGAAGGGHDVELLVAVTKALEDQARPVGRPCGIAVTRRIERDAGLGAAVGVVDVDLLVAVPRARECEPAPVGRPRGVAVLGSDVDDPSAVARAIPVHRRDRDAVRASALHRDQTVRARESRRRLRNNRQEHGRRRQHTLHMPTVIRSTRRCKHFP